MRLTFAAFAMMIAFGVPAAAAYAGEDDNHPGPRAGAACTPKWKVGDELTIDTRTGPQTYRCEQRPGDPCPLWHWVYNPDVPKGQKPPKGCPQCQSSPPASPSSPAASSPPASPPRSSPPATASRSPEPELPVTGESSVPPWRIALFGLGAIGVGAGLIWLACRQRVRGRRRALA